MKKSDFVMFRENFNRNVNEALTVCITWQKIEFKC